MGTVPAGLPAGGKPAHAGSADRLDFRGFRDCPGPRAAQAGGGVWRSLAARFVRDEEAAGSNPATPTSSQGLQPIADRCLARGRGLTVWCRAETDFATPLGHPTPVIKPNAHFAVGILLFSSLPANLAPL